MVEESLTRVVGAHSSTLDPGLEFVSSSGVRVFSLLTPRPNTRPRP